MPQGIHFYIEHVFKHFDKEWRFVLNFSLNIYSYCKKSQSSLKRNPALICLNNSWIIYHSLKVAKGAWLCNHWLAGSVKSSFHTFIITPSLSVYMNFHAFTPSVSYQCTSIAIVIIQCQRLPSSAQCTWGWFDANVNHGLFLQTMFRHILLTNLKTRRLKFFFLHMEHMLCTASSSRDM